MKLIAVIFEPVQEVAAEPGTLDQLTAALRAQLSERLELTVPSAGIGSLLGLPLVADPSLLPGFVYLRPIPARPNPDEQMGEVSEHE